MELNIQKGNDKTVSVDDAGTERPIAYDEVSDEEQGLQELVEGRLRINSGGSLAIYDQRTFHVRYY